MSKLTQNDSRKALFFLVLLTTIFSVLLLAMLKRREFWKKEEVAIQSDEGNRSDENSDLRSFDSLPEDFPADFPVYPNAAITSGWEKGKGVGYAASVLWETDDIPEKVFYFFDGELKNSGWAITGSQNAKDAYTLSFTKEGTSGFLGITKGEKNKTTISVTLK